MQSGAFETDRFEQFRRPHSFSNPPERMERKRGPIITVLVIIGVIALFLGMTMIIVLTIFGSSPGISFNEKIGVILIDGTISHSRQVTTQLVKLRKDDRIKAIILRINSPGGSVGPTQEIYREVRKTVRTKTVVASMGEVAASGGYYIAAAADRIVANPGTVTGSIGVIMHFVRIEALLKKLGINLEVIKSGEFKDVGSPIRKLTERDWEIIEALLSDIQKQFVEGVAKGRALSVEKVQKIADGRIFSGARAKKLGLVDVLGNFQDAVELAKNMAHIEGDVTLVYPKKSRLELWDALLGRAADSVVQLLQRIQTRAEYRWQGFPDHSLRESY